MATFTQPVVKLTVSAVRTAIGDNADRWTEKGLAFIGFRTSPRGKDPIHCSAVMELYQSGAIAKLPANLLKDIADLTESGYTNLSPEAAAIILMGRMPRQRAGKWEEHSKRLTEGQFIAAQKLANRLKKLDGVYVNSAPRRKPVEVDAPETVDTEHKDSSEA